MMVRRDVASKVIFTLAGLLAVGTLILIVQLSPGGPSASAGAPPPTPTSVPPDFSIGINSDGVSGDDCDTRGGPTTCSFPRGSMLTVSGYLDSLGSAAEGAGFLAVSTYLEFSGVTAMMLPMPSWPGCAFPGRDYGTTWAYAACGIGAVASPSFFTGRISSFFFTCDDSGQIQQVNGPDKTLMIVYPGQDQYDDDANETLTIQCLDPAPYPTDTDGDGCPDMREAGPSPYTGGQRNFLNPWDYFNPTHDGQNRIDDPLAALNQYFIDEGNPMYTQDTDRTYVGPNKWDLGPPDGKQRVDDMLNALYQYYHDCS